MFTFLYFSSIANSYVQYYPVLLFFAIVLGFYTHKHYIVNSKVYIMLIATIILYTIGIKFVFNSYPEIRFTIRYSSYFLIGTYFSIIFYGKFFKLFERCMITLSLISLAFFILQSIQYQWLFDFMNFFSDHLGIKNPSYIGRESNYVNAIIYTINNSRFDEQFRNCGFAFEPGYFAILVALALYSNLIINDFKINFKALIFIITLITTFSTIGMIALLLILIHYGLSKKGKAIIIIFPAIVTIAITIFNSPLVSEKTIRLWEARNIDYKKIAMENKEKTISLGRFAGIFYHYNEVYTRSPILGFFGVKDSEKISNLTSANGIGYLMYYFGFLGLILYVIGLYITTKRLIKIEQDRPFHIILFIILLLSLFAFPMINSVLFWFIGTYGVVNINKKNQKFIRY